MRTGARFPTLFLILKFGEAYVDSFLFFITSLKFYFLLRSDQSDLFDT